MNVINLLILAVVIASIVALARVLAPVLGIDATVLGLVMGGVFFLFLILWGEYARRNEFPVCANGRCRSGQYQGVPGSLGSEGYVVECQCGTRYLKTWDSRLMILKDTIAVPFKRQVGLGRWFDSGRWIDDEGPERSVPD